MFSPSHRCLLLWLFGLAIFGLSNLAGCAKKVDPQAELLAELTHTDVNLRRTAVAYLREMRPVPEIYISPLIQALNDNDPQVRHTAAEAIGEAGVGAQPVINDIAKISHEHFDPQVRYALQQSVQKIIQSR